jgi:hypothetical protein
MAYQMAMAELVEAKNNGLYQSLLSKSLVKKWM